MALDRIAGSYQQYHEAALEFYRNTDNQQVMKEIIRDAFSRTKAGKK